MSADSYFNQVSEGFLMIGWYDLQDWEKEALENSELEVETQEEPLNEDSFQGREYDEICVFASSNVSAELLEKIRPERVYTRSTGFDHIDIEKAKDLDIEIYNVPHYGSSTVAEHAFGLLLSLSKRIPEAVKRTEHSFSHKGLTGFELAGKKFGVIGTGEIGQKAIEMAKGFNMDVLAYDPYGEESLEDELGFMYVSMKDMLQKADIISLHAPLTDDNRHMFSSEEFEQMSGTVIINTARGALIDSDALLKALKNGNVRAAGLDVLDMEEEMRDLGEYSDQSDFCDTELEANCELIERDDVLVTPHDAFNTEEAKQRILETTLENIVSHPEENRIK